MERQRALSTSTHCVRRAWRHVLALRMPCAHTEDSTAVAAAIGVLNFVDARTSWFDSAVKDALARHNISQVGRQGE
jgi:O-methyltransferase involved in polyketide biosynthesis